MFFAGGDAMLSYRVLHLISKVDLHIATFRRVAQIQFATYD